MPRLNLEIPATASTIEELRRAANESLRRIAEQLGAPMRLEADADASGYRLVNLGDSREGADALNMRTADRRFPRSSAASSGGGGAAGGGSTSTNNGGDASMLVLTVPGTLSVRSSAALLVSLPEGRDVAEVVALVKQAPTGADIRLDILAAGAKYTSVTVPKDASTGKVNSGLKAIAKDQVIALDIVAVGTVFPGSDLTLMIRFR